MNDHSTKVYIQKAPLSDASEAWDMVIQQGEQVVRFALSAQTELVAHQVANAITSLLNIHTCEDINRQFRPEPETVKPMAQCTCSACFAKVDDDKAVWGEYVKILHPGAQYERVIIEWGFLCVECQATCPSDVQRFNDRAVYSRSVKSHMNSKMEG